MLNDDLISAYLDGELDAERRAMVEHTLRTDSGAVARLERMRAADGLLRQAYPATEHARDDLLAEVILAPQTPNVSRDWGVQAAALAATLVFGVLVGSFVGRDVAPPAYAISPREARLLDTVPSGASAMTANGEFQAVLSLRSDAGDVCRQFRLVSASGNTDVLACRSHDAGWQMTAAVTTPVVEGYIPASGETPLDAAIQNLGPVEALEPSQEREMIARGWR